MKTPTCLLVAAPDSTPSAKIKVYIFVHNFAVMLTDFQTVFSQVDYSAMNSHRILV